MLGTELQVQQREERAVALFKGMAVFALKHFHK